MFFKRTAKTRTYDDLLMDLQITECEDDAFFFVLRAMDHEKRVSGRSPGWKSPVPAYIYDYLAKEYSVRL